MTVIWSAIALVALVALLFFAREPVQRTFPYATMQQVAWYALQKGTSLPSEWVALNPDCSQRITFQSAGSFVAASVRTRYGHEPWRRRNRLFDRPWRTFGQRLSG